MKTTGKNPAALLLPIAFLVTIISFAACDKPKEGSRDPEIHGIIWQGELDAFPADAEEDWAFYNTSTGIAYIHAGGRWSILAKSSVNGVPVIWQGTHPSPPENPRPNWAYFNSKDNRPHVFDGAQWQVQGESAPHDGRLVEMAWVPGGVFVMGNPDARLGYSNERPASTVTMTGFYMGKYEVTQEQYQAVMGHNPSAFSGNEAAGETQIRRPVETVRWYDAIIFCNKLSMMEGLAPAYRIDGETDPAAWIAAHGGVPANWNASSRWNHAQIVPDSSGYRLPTEAQWEYAAKGGNGSPGNFIYAGSNTVGDVAWYDSNSRTMTHEAGKKAPNILGLYDMSGNVWEWCWDWYGSYTSAAKSDPSGAPSGSYRVLRGGSWFYSAAIVRSVDRFSYDPFHQFHYIGFRVVRP